MDARIKPSRAIENRGGGVNLDDLSERDSDYGADEKGLACLRRRLTRIVYHFNGKAPVLTASLPNASALRNEATRSLAL